MTNNKELFDRAMEAVTELFEDRSVSKEKAIENLEALQSEIDMLIEGLKY